MGGTDPQSERGNLAFRSVLSEDECRDGKLDRRGYIVELVREPAC